MSARTTMENRWRGKPSTGLTKAKENTYLAVIADTSVVNNDTDTVPVTLTSTANLVPIGEFQTYTDTDRVLIESGIAVLQANVAYAAAANGQGVLTHAAEGVVKAVAKNIAVAGQGTIVGGGTRDVAGTSTNVYFVKGLCTG